jgi:hypothetical protein
MKAVGALTQRDIKDFVMKISLFGRRGEREILNTGGHMSKRTSKAGQSVHLRYGMTWKEARKRALICGL